MQSYYSITKHIGEVIREHKGFKIDNIKIIEDKCVITIRRDFSHVK